MKNLHVLLLALYLVISGVLTFLNVAFPIVNVLMGIFAVAVGVFIIKAGKQNIFSFVVSILLAIFFILYGLAAIFGHLFQYSNLVTGILAILVGVIIIVINKKKKVIDFIGGFLLSVWLLLQGLVGLINLSFAFLPQVIAVVAVVGGVFIYLNHK